MANLKPHQYTTLPPFRAWCQKVIPLVYDDSLSYYELLCKVIDYLNKMLVDVENMGIDVTNMYAAYNEFTNYVENYLTNLDVQTEINNKLDEMTENGTLTAIIKPLILATLPPYVVEGTEEMVDVNRTYVLKNNSHIYQYVQNSGWIDTGIVYGSSIGNVLTNGGILANGSDLNDISTNTYYFIEVPHKNIQNLPIENTPLWLFTYVTPSTQTKLQIAQVFNKTQYYIRSYHVSWTNWTSLSNFITDTIINNISNNYLHTIPKPNNDTVDANDLKNATILFCETGVATNYINFPTENGSNISGYCITLSTTNLAQQYFFPYQTTFRKAFYYRIKPVGGNYGPWQVMINTPKIFIENSIDYNNILEESNYLIPDRTTITNSPSPGAAQILKTVYYGNGIYYQICTAFTTYNRIYTRTKIRQNNWTKWVEIGGDTINYTINKTIAENTYNNTYNITTNPNFTTDENGWLNSVDNESTSEENATDMTGAIMSLLNNTGYCHLGVGTFYVSGGITLPNGSTIEGCGDKTIVRLLSSSNNYVFRPVRLSTIQNLKISGAKSLTISENIGNKNGIYFYDTKTDWTSSGEKDTRPCFINSVSFNNFNGAAIYGHGTGGGLDESLIVSNCYINNCNSGINLNFFVEYCKFTNIIIVNCYYACINNGGNNVFIGCTFHGNTGFVIDNSSKDKINNAHGSCIGCTFNHVGNNTGDAIQINGTTNGFLFEGSQIWYGKIKINDSQGILFNGFLGGGNTTTIEVSNSTGITFRNGQFNMNPPIISANNTRLTFDNVINWLTGNIIEPTYN